MKPRGRRGQTDAVETRSIALVHLLVFQGRVYVGYCRVDVGFHVQQ